MRSLLHECRCNWLPGILKAICSNLSDGEMLMATCNGSVGQLCFEIFLCDHVSRYADKSCCDME